VFGLVLLELFFKNEDEVFEVSKDAYSGII